MGDQPQLQIRSAVNADVPAIVELLADDVIGQTREQASGATLQKYYSAFAAIEQDDRNHLMVAELDGEVVGTYQVTYIPYLSRGGNERALIEAVRVSTALRGESIGTQMMKYALDCARNRGCLLAQLTTDKRRADAHRFYSALGFESTHEGMKLQLQGPKSW